MDRITTRDLESMVKIINRMTGHAETPYMSREKGFKPNPGNYHLSGAYGGWSLDQMCDTGTGTKDVFGCGHVSKRDLYNRMRAFIDGLEARGQ